MHTYFKSLIACFFAMAAIGVARADQDLSKSGIRHPEQVREQIEHLYQLEQAFLVCEHVRVIPSPLMRDSFWLSKSVGV